MLIRERLAYVTEKNTAVLQNRWIKVGWGFAPDVNIQIFVIGLIELKLKFIWEVHVLNSEETELREKRDAKCLNWPTRLVGRPSISNGENRSVPYSSSSTSHLAWPNSLKHHLVFGEKNRFGSNRALRVLSNCWLLGHRSTTNEGSSSPSRSLV